MRWGKILGGAVTGLIVGGPIGAIAGATAGAAVIAATGVAANAIAVDNEEKRAAEKQKIARTHQELAEQNEQRQLSFYKQESESIKREIKASELTEKVRNTIENYKENVYDEAEHAQLIIAFMAIGLASAHADGDTSQAELAELKIFLEET